MCALDAMRLNSNSILTRFSPFWSLFLQHFSFKLYNTIPCFIVAKTKCYVAIICVFTRTSRVNIYQNLKCTQLRAQNVSALNCVVCKCFMLAHIFKIVFVVFILSLRASTFLSFQCLDVNVTR